MSEDIKTNKILQLIDGSLFDRKEETKITKNTKKILFQKFPDWKDPEDSNRGTNAIGRVIHNYANILTDSYGYGVDIEWTPQMKREDFTKYDFVHCSFWFECMDCLAMGIPYIFNIHDNSALLAKEGTHFYDIMWKSIEYSVVTIAQTDQSREKWKDLDHKIITIPVPIDTDYFSIDDNVEREDFVLSAGSISTIKGHRYLIKACMEMGLTLMIFGDEDSNSEVEYVKQAVEDSNGLITWYKAVPIEHLRGFYRRCKVFALTTEMDVPGLVYLEALSCGANVVASEQGVYKSDNPKISRCVFNDIGSIKEALEKAWTMPIDTIGSEQVKQVHHPNRTTEMYNNLVYNKEWDMKSHSTVERVKGIYNLSLINKSPSGNFGFGEGNISFTYSRKPNTFSSDLEYIFRVWQNDKKVWDDVDLFTDGISNPKFSSCKYRRGDDVRYELYLGGHLIETGFKKKFDDDFEINYIDDLNSLFDGGSSNIIKPINNAEIVLQDTKMDFDINFIHNDSRTKDWELVIDEMMMNNVSLEMYTWPLLTKEFCRKLIDFVEERGDWTSDRHENYPTHDIHLDALGLDDLYNQILNEYVHPVARHVWDLTSRQWNNDELKTENFIAKYDTESVDAQAHLGIHHEKSHYSTIVGLSDGYEGGGTWFPKQRMLVNRPIGYITLHPQCVTHRHGARSVTSGVRYVLVTFVQSGSFDTPDQKEEKIKISEKDDYGTRPTEPYYYISYDDNKFHWATGTNLGERGVESLRILVRSQTDSLQSADNYIIHAIYEEGDLNKRWEMEEGIPNELTEYSVFINKQRVEHGVKEEGGTFFNIEYYDFKR